MDADPLLESLRSAGSPDSTGRFTLDPQQALEKLRRHALADPERFIVHLVEAAAMGGADEVRVGLGWSWTSVEFGGRPLREPELRGLLGGLLTGRWTTRDRMHPLALAVNALLGGLAAEVVVEGRRIRARYRRDGLHVEGAEGRGNRVLVRRARPRGLWNFLAGGPELALLEEHCPYSPPRVRLEGRTSDVNRPPAFGPGLMQACLDDPRVPLPLARPAGLLQRASPAGGRFSAVLVLGGPATPGLLIVSGGRVFRLKADLAPGLSILAKVSRMPTDLTRTSLARGTHLEALLDALRAEAEEMHFDLARRFGEVPEELRGWASSVARASMDFLVQARRYPEALRIAVPLARLSPGTESEAALYRCALHLQEAGDPAGARSHAIEAVERRTTRLGLRVRDEPGPLREPLLLGLSLEGPAQAVKDMLDWLLFLEERVLGPEHRIARARQAALARFVEARGLEPSRKAAWEIPPDLEAGPPPEVLRRLRELVG